MQDAAADITAQTFLVLRSTFFDENGDPVIHTVAGVDEYECMVEHFSDCVLNNKSPRYPALEAALNMRVIEALYASVQAGGKPVTIEPLS